MLLNIYAKWELTGLFGGLSFGTKINPKGYKFGIKL